MFSISNNEASTSISAFLLAKLLKYFTCDTNFELYVGANLVVASINKRKFLSSLFYR